MNIEEVYFLSEWVGSYVEQASRLYEPVRKKLDQAANFRVRQNQSASEPPSIKPDADKLKGFLRRMPFENLNQQQLNRLMSHDIGQYVGKRGVGFVDTLLLDANYDPKFASKEIEKAKNALDACAVGFRNLKEGINSAQIIDHSISGDADGETLVRVTFDHDIAIKNTADLKKSTGDLEVIVRGVAEWCGERVEDVRVVSASRGSLIFDLGAGLIVAKAFIFISRDLLKLAKEGVELASQIQDLKQRRVLNDVAKKEILKEHKSKIDKAPDEIIRTIENELDISGNSEVRGKAKSAIKKMSEFLKKGGSLDVIERRPPSEESVNEGDESEEESIGNGSEELDGLRSAAEEARMITREMRMIEEDHDFKGS